MAGNLSFEAANTVSNSISELKSSIARLASGVRITSAADDAAGLAVRELIRADIATMRQSQRNLSDGASMLQTAEGAAQAVNKNLIRMSELATQASSPTYSLAQKRIMQQEFDQLAADNTRITQQAQFNQTPLFTEGRIDIAAGDGTTISFNTQPLTMSATDFISGPLTAASNVKAAINQTSSYRGLLGSAIQRLESAGEVLSIQAENLLAADSRIADADIAVEVSQMTARNLKFSVAAASQVHAGSIAQITQLLMG